MANEMIKFPSIESTRTVFPKIVKAARLVRFDMETKEAIYDESKILPILEFRGTVKLHGANCSIVQTIKSKSLDSLYFQSRNKVLTEDEDFMGFYAHMSKKEETRVVEALFEVIRNSLFSKGKQARKIVIFGEWCGQGIQKAVALSSVPKMFVIFAIQVLYRPETKKIEKPLEEWVNLLKLSGQLKGEKARIFNVYQFPTFSIVIDFNDKISVEAAQKEIESSTLAVEQECPAGKFFGVDGTGEGIVWQAISCPNPPYKIQEQYTMPKFWFKSKGAKHTQNGRPISLPQLTPLDSERMQNMKKFVNSVLTEGRLEQGYQYIVREKMLPPEKKRFGAFLTWVKCDIDKEESDRMVEAETDSEKISKCLGALARKWFDERLKESPLAS